MRRGSRRVRRTYFHHRGNAEEFARKNGGVVKANKPRAKHTWRVEQVGG